MVWGSWSSLEDALGKDPWTPAGLAGPHLELSPGGPCKGGLLPLWGQVIV